MCPQATSAPGDDFSTLNRRKEPCRAEDGEEGALSPGEARRKLNHTRHRDNEIKFVPVFVPVHHGQVMAMMFHTVSASRGSRTRCRVCPSRFAPLETPTRKKHIWIAFAVMNGVTNNSQYFHLRILEQTRRTTPTVDSSMSAWVLCSIQASLQARSHLRWDSL